MISVPAATWQGPMIRNPYRGNIEFYKAGGSATWKKNKRNELEISISQIVDKGELSNENFQVWLCTPYSPGDDIGMHVCLHDEVKQIENDWIAVTKRAFYVQADTVNKLTHIPQLSEQIDTDNSTDEVDIEGGFQVKLF